MKGEIAIKDASSAITTSEMQMLIAVCDSRYNKVAKLIKSFEKTSEMAVEKVKDLKKHMGLDGNTEDSVEFKAIMKITEGVHKKMQREFMQELGAEINGFEDLVEFLNKFTSEKYENIDLGIVLNKECPWNK